jgi:hypothetical protein
MKVTLKDTWLDNPEGSVLDLKESVANSLIERGVAVSVEEKKGFKRSEVNKMVDNPQINK